MIWSSQVIRGRRRRVECGPACGLLSCRGAGLVSCQLHVPARQRHVLSRQRHVPARQRRRDPHAGGVESEQVLHLPRRAARAERDTVRERPCESGTMTSDVGASGRGTEVKGDRSLWEAWERSHIGESRKAPTCRQGFCPTLLFGHVRMRGLTAPGRTTPHHHPMLLRSASDLRLPPLIAAGQIACHRATPAPLSQCATRQSTRFR